MPFTLPIGASAQTSAFPPPTAVLLARRLRGGEGSGRLLHLQPLPVCHRLQRDHQADRGEVHEPGGQVRGINSNTILVAAGDSFKQMIRVMEQERFPWVYLRDEAQTAALAYGALRTRTSTCSTPSASSSTPARR